MSVELKQNGKFHALLADHANLRQALDAVSETISQRSGRPTMVAKMIGELAGRILSHFRHEERGGHLAQAMDAAPHLAVQADGLLQEHEELAQSLAALQRQAAAADDSSSWWEDLEDMFVFFLYRFLEHEEAENRLLQAAYNEDIGAED
jgi:hypothetical protein